MLSMKSKQHSTHAYAFNYKSIYRLITQHGIASTSAPDKNNSKQHNNQHTQLHSTHATGQNKLSTKPVTTYKLPLTNLEIKLKSNFIESQLLRESQTKVSTPIKNDVQALHDFSFNANFADFVGHIVYSRAKIIDKQGVEKEVVSFGPVSVLPGFQKHPKDQDSPHLSHRRCWPSWYACLNPTHKNIAVVPLF